jgi:hypothetical protein
MSREKYARGEGTLRAAIISYCQNLDGNTSGKCSHFTILAIVEQQVNASPKILLPSSNVNGANNVIVFQKKLWGNCGGDLKKPTASGVYWCTSERLQLVTNVNGCACTVPGAHVHERVRSPSPAPNFLSKSAKFDRLTSQKSDRPPKRPPAPSEIN